jgi:pimeloyl-ACP methyl ester carboxylesterase
VVILLHGGLSTHETWLPLAPTLATRFRLITPDLRCSGRSHDSSPLTWDRLADDVAALARHVGAERAAIGGASFGAACAVRVALRFPELVDRLVLIHPAYGGDELGLSTAQQRAMAAMGAAGERALAEGMTAFDPLLDTLPAAIRERARATVATYDPASVAALTRFIASNVQPFARASELAVITAPALVVPGVDEQHPVAVAAVFAAHLPRCTVRDVAPPDFAAAIVEHLDREP